MNPVHAVPVENGPPIVVVQQPAYAAPQPVYAQPVSGQPIVIVQPGVQPQPAGPPVIVIQQPGALAVAVTLGHTPQYVTCPVCAHNVTTNVEHIWGESAFIVCCGCILCMGIPCALLPCCIDEMQDARHSCPHCNVVIKVVRGRVCP